MTKLWDGYFENKRNKSISCEGFLSMLKSDIVSLQYGFQTQGYKHLNKNCALIFKDILYWDPLLKPEIANTCSSHQSEVLVVHTC